MKKITINNIEDVKSFFQFLYDEYDLIYHPDDSFHEYIDNTSALVFSEDQAEYLDSVMQKCFDVCGIKIYEVMELYRGRSSEGEDMFVMFSCNISFNRIACQF